MKLAINYSRPAADLVKSGKITVDYFKTPDWDWIINEAQETKPVAVHFTLEVGNGNLDQFNWQRILHICTYTQTPFINFHLDSRGCYFPDIPVDSIENPDNQKIYEIIQSELAEAVKLVGANRIILENSPYRGEDGSTMRACVEPDLITQLVLESGCGLLLDISHAVISARTIGIQPDDYISRLPMDRLKEMHFAGICKNQLTGQWMDHLSVQEEDWFWLDWVLQRIQKSGWPEPWLLVFEYGVVGQPFEWRTDPQVIAEQVPLISTRLEKHYAYQNRNI
jgi:uncharacterized protein (UPF0276 family)